MERCPNCKARQRGEDLCQRCGIDLSTLLAIETRAVDWERLAVARLASGDPLGARAAADQALRWQQRELAAALRGFSAWLEAAASPGDRHSEAPGRERDRW